jgi:hypothetical protein
MMPNNMRTSNQKTKFYRGLRYLALSSMGALLITINNFSFMQVNQGYGTNSLPHPAGQKEGICGT